MAQIQGATPLNKLLYGLIIKHVNGVTTTLFKYEDDSTVFRFGDGEERISKKMVNIPATMGNLISRLI